MKQKRINLIFLFLTGGILIFLFLHRILNYEDTNKLVRFTSSQYAPYAYQIAPGELSKQAKLALSRFQITQKHLTSDQTRIDIRPKGPFAWKTFILRNGYVLYLALLPDQEGEINDMTNLDYLQYDIPVLVNDKGYIVTP